MGLIRKELDNLKEADIMSFILFALYKLRETPEYSGLSELLFILDKNSVFKLCEYFGGLTIKIPTISDLELLLNSLLVYKAIDIDKRDSEEVFSELKETLDMRDVKKTYIKLRDLLNSYELSSRSDIWKNM